MNELVRNFYWDRGQTLASVLVDPKGTRPKRTYSFDPQPLPNNLPNSPEKTEVEKYIRDFRRVFKEFDKRRAEVDSSKVVRSQFISSLLPHVKPVSLLFPPPYLLSFHFFFYSS